MRCLAFLVALLLAACGSNPDTRVSDGEAKLAAKAVADVDAARADAAHPDTQPPIAALPAKP
jgi:uncharacterized protein YcfL